MRAWSRFLTNRPSLLENDLATTLSNSFISVSYTIYCKYWYKIDHTLILSVPSHVSPFLLLTSVVRSLVSWVNWGALGDTVTSVSVRSCSRTTICSLIQRMLYLKVDCLVRVVTNVLKVDQAMLPCSCKECNIQLVAIIF